jgi:UDP-glucose 6-dehydrogenase
MGNPVDIAVVGSGYVGLVAAVCFAEMGHRVICVDNDPSKVKALQGGDSLIHEEYLPELLNRYSQRLAMPTSPMWKRWRVRLRVISSPTR